ncbi:hypothetical protein EVA_16960 [gut metagenome]|uniref:Uncharacterized protein n=1 Tax=gut metagenome TaxID=749906 RepID=J9FZF7_9ZZZZ
MSSIHLSFSSRTSQHPCNSWDFWNVTLTVKNNSIRIETSGEPCRSDLQYGYVQSDLDLDT